MKKTTTIGLVISLIKTFDSYSQDVINPYLLRETGTPQSTYSFVNINVSVPANSYNFLWKSTPDEDVSTSTGYIGEYMISLKFNSWHGNYKAQSGSLIYYNSGLTEFGQYTKTYSTEVVSFPFTINCYDGLNGCADAITAPPVRNMYMPDLSHTYNATGKYWESSLASSGTNNPIPLRNMHENLCFNATEGMSAQSCPNNYAGRLVSNEFVSGIQLGAWAGGGSIGMSLLPHTAIKHTVYLHCPVTNDVVTQFSWIYDNTRGMMRCYPFTDSNVGGQSGDHQWDVMFVPMLLMENATSTPPVNFYNRTNNFDPLSGEGIFPGGTINYYPFSEIDNNGCTTFPLPNSSDVFNQSALGGPTGQPTSYPYYLYEPIGAGNSYPFFAPYLLLSAPLRNAKGRDLAGYTNLNIDEMEPILQPSQRIWQQYHIDQNIDLSIINPSEKTIYNPSEVTITADNLIFPNDYTFKTIRGVYPSALDEVLPQNTVQNCGYYNDLRQVPVRTDLRFDPNATSTGATYPHDPTVPQNSVYASVYTMEGGSKITIGNCTRIFDATFKVNTGATLIFNDYSQTCGYEDMSYTLGRYKLIGNGGAILRNYDLTQYVQNGVITQDLSATPYIAQNTIIAGDDDYLPPYDTDENPDLVQADGPYEIQTGGEVEFIAGDFIHLRDGFSVSGGKFHAKTVGTVAMPDMCYYQQLQGGGNRMAGNQTYNQNISIFNVTPNPGNGMFNLTVNAMDDKAMLYVEDMFGKNILQQKVNNYKTALDLNNLPKGVYFVKYFCYNTMQSKKVVIQ